MGFRTCGRIAFGDMAECPLNHLLSLGEQFQQRNAGNSGGFSFPKRGVSALTPYPLPLLLPSVSCSEPGASMRNDKAQRKRRVPRMAPRARLPCATRGLTSEGRCHCRTWASRPLAQPPGLIPASHPDSLPLLPGTSWHGRYPGPSTPPRILLTLFGQHGKDHRLEK